MRIRSAPSLRALRLALVTLCVAALTACETDVAPGSVQSSAMARAPKAPARFASLPHGFRFSSIDQLQSIDSTGATMTLAHEDEYKLFLDAIWVGDVPLDAAALREAALSPIGVNARGNDVVREEPTERDGQTWQNYAYSADSAQGARWSHYSYTRRGPYIYRVVGVTVSPVNKHTETVLRQAWRNVDFVEPTASGPATKDETDEAVSALMAGWSAYIERRLFDPALEIVRTSESIAPSEPKLAQAELVTYISCGRYQSGVERAKELAQRFPEARGIVWRYAYLLGETGKTSEALAQYQRALLDLGERDPTVLGTYFSFLSGTRQLGDHVDEVKELVGDSKNTNLRLYLAYAYLAAGREEALAAEIESLASRDQLSPDAVQGLVVLLCEQKHFEEAKSVANMLQGTPAGHYLQGIIAMHESRFSDARKELQACLAMQPNHSDAQQALDITNAQLGKADSSTFRNAIEPVALPPALDPAAPQGATFVDSIPPAPKDFAGDHGAYSDYYCVMYGYEPDAPVRHTLYERYTVTEASAIDRMSELSYPFDPLFERVYVNYLRVYGPDGEEIAEGKLENYYTSVDPDQTLISQRKELHLPVPSLEVGCSVEVAVSYETLAPQDDMMYAKQVLSSDIPTQYVVMGFRGDTSVLNSSARNGAQELEDDADGLRVYWTRNPEPQLMMASLPPARDYLPMVWFGAAGKTWEGLAEDYIERAADHFEPDEAAKAKEAEIVPPGASQKEAIEAITKFVRENLTYQGLLFGVRAQIPNSCSDILANRYGDCKDHSFLLMQMLRAAGVRAFPALIASNYTGNVDVPDLSQFDHMIVYLPDYEGGRFVDTTDKFGRLEATPTGLAGEPTLVIDPENPRIEIVPDYAPGANSMDVDRSLSFDGASVRVEETVNLHGYWAGWVRGALQDVTRREYPLALSRFLRMPELDDLRDVQVENLADREADLKISYNYTLERQFLEAGPLLAGRVPASWEMLLLHLSPTEDGRKAPFWQQLPLEVKTQVRVSIPSDYELAAATPLKNEASDNPFCAFALSTHPSGKQLELDCEFNVSSGIFPASSADARRQAFNGAAEAVQYPIVLHRQQSGSAITVLPVQ